MFLAVVTSVFAFLFFINIKIPYNRLINTIAASSFGVFLIHTNSDSMRRWLWEDIVDCRGHYEDSLMPLYSMACVVGIYTVCAAIDMVRMSIIEKLCSE